MGYRDENVAPAASSQDPSTGEVAKSFANDCRTQQHRDWRRRIDSSDCPLSAWESYTQWVKSTTLEGGEEYVNALRQCIKELPEERYRCDCRYLRIWVKYAGCHQLPEQRRIMEHLEAQSIGVEHALFYIAFGTLLEKLRDFGAAQAAYEQGLQRNAEPVSKIQANYDKFKGRMENRRRRAERAAAVNTGSSAASTSGSKRKQTTPFKEAGGPGDPQPSAGSLGRTEPQGDCDKKPQGLVRCGYDASLLLLSGKGGGPLCFEEVRAQHWLAKRGAAAGDPPPFAAHFGQQQQEAPASVVRHLNLRTPTAELDIGGLQGGIDLAPTPLPASPGAPGAAEDWTLGIGPDPFGAEAMPSAGLCAERPAPGTGVTPTPTMTVNTRAALSEINGMFQEKLPFDPEEDAGPSPGACKEPTVTAATRAALGAIDAMFQGDLPSGGPAATAVAQSPQIPELVAAGSLSPEPQTVQKQTPGGASAEPEAWVPAATLDPFTSELRDSILSALCPPLEQWPGVFVEDDEDEVRDALQQLQASGSHVRDGEREQAFLELGSQAFCVKGILGSGAYAKCFEVDWLGDEETEVGGNEESEESLAALKVEAPASAWEFYIGRVLQGRLAEAGGGATASRRFVRMRQLHLGAGASFLVTSLGMYGNLQELLNAYRSQGQAALPEGVALFYAMDLCCMMADLHTCGIVHADIKPDNLLVRHPGPEGWSSWDMQDPASWGGPAGLQLIDFGRSVDVEALPQEAEFLADCKPGCFRCIEMQEGRPWKYQVDAYGAASVMHFMLFGEYIKVQRVTDPSRGGEVSYRLRNPFRRYWATAIWEEAFRLLLNIQPGGSRPPWGTLVKLFQDHWMSVPEASQVQLQTDLRKQAILLHKD